MNDATGFKLGPQFVMNQTSWKVIERYDGWLFCEGSRMNPGAGRPQKLWDCANVRYDHLGNEEIPSTLGVENSLENYNFETIKERFERGKDKLQTDKLRKEKAIKAERDYLRAEQHRMELVSESESLKKSLRIEFDSLTEKAKNFQEIYNNKKAMELLEKIAAVDRYQYYHRIPIVKN